MSSPPGSSVVPSGTSGTCRVSSETSGTPSSQRSSGTSGTPGASCRELSGTPGTSGPSCLESPGAFGTSTSREPPGTSGISGTCSRRSSGTSGTSGTCSRRSSGTSGTSGTSCREGLNGPRSTSSSLAASGAPSCDLSSGTSLNSPSTAMSRMSSFFSSFLCKGPSGGCGPGVGRGAANPALHSPCRRAAAPPGVSSSAAGATAERSWTCWRRSATSKRNA
mmetsp:Transcript_17549/g.36547  ORF Transcript_17549/g.36547 Transcript_17549/m.36547 type:complete len:221 (+) Transcript_17549:489-1151(+)